MEISESNTSSSSFTFPHICDHRFEEFPSLHVDCIRMPLNLYSSQDLDLAPTFKALLLGFLIYLLCVKSWLLPCLWDIGTEFKAFPGVCTPIAVYFSGISHFTSPSLDSWILKLPSSAGVSFSSRSSPDSVNGTAILPARDMELSLILFLHPFCGTFVLHPVVCSVLLCSSQNLLSCHNSGPSLWYLLPGPHRTYICVNLWSISLAAAQVIQILMITEWHWPA